jgi:hypothetical protein
MNTAKGPPATANAAVPETPRPAPTAAPFATPFVLPTANASKLVAGVKREGAMTTEPHASLLVSVGDLGSTAQAVMALTKKLNKNKRKTAKSSPNCIFVIMFSATYYYFLIFRK